MEVHVINYITAASAVAGLMIWGFLFQRERKKNLQLMHLVLALLFIGFFCRFAFAFFTPEFYAPDEKAHFNYVKYLAENHSFPVQQKDASWNDNEYEYYQPPVYYITAAIVAFPLFALDADDGFILLVLRTLNIVFWMFNLLIVLKILQKINVRDNFTIIMVMLLFTMLPTFTSNSSTVNNDILTILLGHVFLLKCLELPKWRAVIWAGVLLGLAMLTKLTAVVFGIFLGLTLLYKLADKKANLKEAIIQPALIAAIAFLFWLPWGLRNIELYNEFTATEWGNKRPLEDFWSILEFSYEYSINSFWSVAGQFNNVYYMKKVGKGIMLASFGGLLAYFLYFRKRIVNVLENDHRFLKYFVWGGAFAFIVNYLLMMHFGVTYGQAQGRFLFPLLMPLGFVMANGFYFFRKNMPYFQVHLIGLFIIYNISFVVYSLLTIYRIVGEQ